MDPVTGTVIAGLTVGELASIAAAVGTVGNALVNLIKFTHQLNDESVAAGAAMQAMFLMPGPAIDTLSGKINSLTSVDMDKLVGTAINTSNAINDLAEKSGVAASDLSVLAAAADAQNVSLETLGGGFGSLNSAIDGALGSNEEMRGAFERLGISVDDLKSKSTRDLFLEMSNGLAGIEDPATRAAIAHQILGQSAEALLPTMLSLAGDGFQNAIEQASLLGQIISGPAAESASHFEQNLARLKGSLVGNAQMVIGLVLPAINAIADLFLETGNSRIPAFLNPVKILTTVVHGLGSAFISLGGFINAAFHVAQTFFSGIDDWIKGMLTGKGGGGFGAAMKEQFQKEMAEIAELRKFMLQPPVNQPEVANRPERPASGGGTPIPSTQINVNIEAAMKAAQVAIEKAEIAAGNTAKHMEHTTAQATTTAKAVDDQRKSHEDIAAKLEASLPAAQAAAASAEQTRHATERNVELEQLRGDKLKSSADVERIAALERDAAMDTYNSKIDAAKTKADAARDALGPKPETGPALAIWQAHFDAIGREEKAVMSAATTQLEQEKTRIARAEEAGRLEVKKQFFGSAELEELAIKRRTELSKGTIEGEEHAKQIEARMNAEITAHGQMVSQFATYATAMGTGVKDAILKGLETGNFEDAMGGIVKAFEGLWKGALDKILTKFFQDLGTIASGQQLKDKDNNPLSGMSQTTAKGIMGGMAAIAIGMDAYSKGAMPGGRTAGTIGGALSGASMGATWGGATFSVYGAVVGAVVGAIVGAIGAAMGAAAAREDYKFGVPNIDKKGNVSWTKLDDLSKGEIDSYTTKITATYREFWNGYTNILMKLPGGNLPEPKGITGDFQERASKNYLKHLNEWLEQTLPREIADEFKAGMKDAFQAAGVGAQAFDEFWKEAEKMDPKKALQFWNDLSEGLIAFDKAASTRRNIEDVGHNWADAQFLSDGTNRKPNESEFNANLRTQTQGIFDVARQMIHLAGPERAAAWKTLGQNVQQVMTSLTDYLNQVGEAMRGVKETIENTRFEWGLENLKNDKGEVDKPALIEALKGQLDSVMNKIAQAAELGLAPGDVEKLVQQAIQLTDRIYQVDPDAVGNDFRLQQLDLIEQLSTEALAKMAEEAKSAVDKLMAEIEPFKDWFLGLTEPDIPGAMKDLENAFPGFKQAILDLQEVIGGTTGSNMRATSQSSNVSDGSEDGGTTGGQGTNNVVNIAEYVDATRKLNERLVDIEAKRAQAEQERAARGQTAETPVNITVNVNGAMVGISELQTNVTRAAVAGVVEAIRNQPSIIEHPFALGG